MRSGECEVEPEEQRWSEIRRERWTSEPERKRAVGGPSIVVRRLASGVIVPVEWV